MSNPSTKKWDPNEAIEPHILAKLDPDFVAIFTKMMNENPPPPRDQLTIPQLRDNPSLLAPPCALDTAGYPRTAEKELVSEDGASIPVRLYYPDESRYGPGPYPVHLNFHGGGFVLGGLSNESTLCMSMCDGAGVVVVDVNYRHCPETIWGKCMQDGWAALKWVRGEAASLNIKPDSISIGGISAGAHITFVLQHLARDADIPLRLAMAAVAPTSEALGYKDFTDSPFPSFAEFARGPVLSWASIKWFGGFCWPDDKMPELRRMWPDWWFSVLRAPDLRGLCPVFIRTAECDTLRDESEAYGMKLVEAGVKVTLKRYRGAVHTFMYYKELKTKQAYDADAIAALKEAHGV